MIKKFSLILILLSLSSLAYAQVDYQNLNPNGLINSLISNFIEEIKLVSKPIKQASKNLFWILVPISIFLNGFKCIFAEGNIQTFFYALVKIILVIINIIFVILGYIYFYLIMEWRLRRLSSTLLYKLSIMKIMDHQSF